MTAFDLNQIDRVLTTTKSVRRRLDLSRPVARQVVIDCIRLASYAPNASNAQEWRWLVVDDRELCRQVGEAYRRVTVGPVTDMLNTKLAAGDEAGARISRSILYLADHMGEVPILVLPLLPFPARHHHPATAGLPDVPGSIYPAVWSFQLALRSRGLGSAFTTAHTLDEEGISPGARNPARLDADLSDSGRPHGRGGTSPRRPVAPSRSSWRGTAGTLRRPTPSAAVDQLSETVELPASPRRVRAVGTRNTTSRAADRLVVVDLGQIGSDAEGDDRQVGRVATRLLHGLSKIGQGGPGSATADRHPAVAIRGNSGESFRAGGGADKHGRARPLHRLGPLPGRLEADMVAVELGHVVGPQRLGRLDGLGHHVSSTRELDAVVLGLFAIPSEPDSPDESPAGDEVQAWRPRLARAMASCLSRQADRCPRRSVEVTEAAAARAIYGS